MIDKVFEMLKKDSTRYVVNKEKQYELEKLTTLIRLVIIRASTSMGLNYCHLCSTVLTKHHEKLLDMQCLLATVQTVAFSLKQEAVTVSEINKYCKKHYASALAQSRKLIITAIVNRYLEEIKSGNQK